MANTITLVGDVDQLLYRFAGAKPELMTEEVDKFVPGIQTYFLSTNYRSTRAIIDVCSSSIANNYADLGGPYAQEFMKATQARPGAPEGAPITFQMLPDVRSEAVAVADTITEEMAVNGYTYGDFYVASRTRAQLAYLEGTLFRAGIKFINLTGGSFWDSYHIRNIVAYLELAYDTQNDDAFSKVYNIASGEHTDRSGDYCHHRWLGREFLRLTGGSYGKMHLAIRQNRRYADGVEDLQYFVRAIQGVIAGTDDASVPLNYILEYCYKPWLVAQGDLLSDGEDGGSSLVDDIAAAMDVASDMTVQDFVEYVQEMRAAAAKAKDGDISEYTVIATFHRLKGSERSVMIMIGVGEGYRKVGLDEVPAGLLPITWALIPPPQFGVLPTGGMGRVDDERCIFFVGVSRAKDKVYIFCPRRYREMILSPSRFIGEVSHLIATIRQEGDDDGAEYQEE